MKKAFKFLALILAATSLSALLTACGNDVSGTYIQAVDSKSYFSAQAVKDDMPETEYRPDGTQAMVPFNGLFALLDPRVAEDIAGTSSAAGVNEFYTVTLELSNKKYTLTKSFNFDMDYVSEQVKAMMSTADKPCISVTFTGSYTADGNTVTLEAPTQIDAQVTPVAGVADAYTRFGGTFTDVSETTASNETYPGRFFNYFNTLYFVENSSLSSMTVTVDKDTGSFTMN